MLTRIKQHVFRHTTLLLAALPLALPAAAGTLALFPDRARLEHAEDLQRVVLQLTRDDGVTLDVTAEAQVHFDAPLAAWREDHKLTPLADGETIAHFTYGDQTLQLPLAVSNATLVRPRSFRNDVEPVLMRAGCNSGGCHGSARGQNGFLLSLFGFDPRMDYTNLTRQLLSRRMNIALPEESLMLTKPTGEVDHDGGTVLERGGHLYEQLRRWIAEGAQNDPADLPHLTGIEILPKEAVLEGEGAMQRFFVRATYSDGSDRDATDLSILSASDDMVLKITPEGHATAAQPGEVYVMARFGTFAVISKVIVSPANKDFLWPEDAQPRNFVDEMVFAKLRKLRIPPATRCSDTAFIRRASLDIAGVLPTVEETRAFLADTDPDKRAKLIDRLLERPEFADVWAMKWADVLKVTAANPDILDRKGMFRYNDWLRHAITSNQPMDQLVRELLTAEGGNFTNPAANFYLVESDPVLIAENVAQVFMGIQIKCAQCHNHPFERWTMEDYYSFAAFFGQVGRKASSDPREQVVFNRASGDVKNIKDGAVMAPKFLGGDTPDVSGKDRRAVLAEWLTSPENPWFAKNIANRVWQNFFGAGIIDPVDDVRVTNPPSNPQLLDELGRRMIEYNYDLRRMVRDICNSYTYQMSTHPRDPAITDTKNFAFAQVRRLSAEQLLDAIGQVTNTKTKFPSLPLGARAAEVADGASGIYFLDVFGRPPRTSVCACDRKGEPTLAQSLHLINGSTVNAAIKQTGGLLDQLLTAQTPTNDILDTLYLAAVSRPPQEEERVQLAQYVDTATDRRAAMEDVFWTLLNSKEFMFNH
jgi:hypothetical protein